MSDRLDVNAATADPLDAVPRFVGHGYKIVGYRGEPEQFAALRQLDKTPGLSGKVDNAARECLSVD